MKSIVIALAVVVFGLLILLHFGEAGNSQNNLHKTFQTQTIAGYWYGYKVTWVGDDSSSPAVGFYLFEKVEGDRTSEEYKRMELVGYVQGVELYFTRDDSSTRGHGFYATKVNGQFQPMFSSAIKSHKSTRSQGQYLIEPK